MKEGIPFWKILLEKKVYDMETDRALLATIQSKIEELENKISNQCDQFAKYEETQESLFKDKQTLQIIRIRIYRFRWWTKRY